MRQPISLLPVKAIIRTPGWSTSGSPSTSSVPVRNCTAFRGRPASNSSSTIRYDESGVSPAGFHRTVFPAASAPSAMPSGMALGKFHGLMHATTPSGSYTVVTCSSGMGYTALPCAQRSVSRAKTSK